MSEWAFKRFWTDAAPAEDGDGWRVELDGRPVKTPAKQTLSLPTPDLAQAVAAEWNAVDTLVKPDLMPLTRLSNSALDKVAVQHGPVADLLTEYGGSDLLCYRADGPQALIDRQTEAWDPLLDWVAAEHGIRLDVQTGVMPVAQPTDSLGRVRDLTHGLDPFALTGFHELVSISGSWVLGYAALQRARPAADLFDIAALDELYQAEQWGDDDEALAVRANKRAAFLTAAEFTALSTPAGPRRLH